MSYANTRQGNLFDRKAYFAQTHLLYTVDENL